MGRYFRLWAQFLRMSWMADIEYRANIILRVINEFFWYSMQLSVFEVLYLHTNSIAGWDVNEMRVFMGTLFVADVLFMILLHENMEQIWSLVRKGDLDTYLVKPINSQFMVSFRKVSVSYVLNFFMVLGYLIWALSRLEQGITMIQIATLFWLMICGLVINYSMRFMFASLTLVLQGAGNVQFIWYQLFRLATRPDPIYPSYLRYVVLMVIPVAFIASVPSRVVVEGIEPVYLISAPLLAAFMLYLSSVFWRWALRHYSSASS